MHSAGLELTKLTYTRLEDNLIRHRGDRYDTAATAIAAALLHDAPVGVDCCCIVASISMSSCCVSINLFSLCPEIYVFVSVNLNIGYLYSWAHWCMLHLRCDTAATAAVCLALKEWPRR